MSGYTPSEEEVRVRESVGSGWSAPYRDALKARFDRFLAEDRRKTAARAWSEGFDAAGTFAEGPDWAPVPGNPYRKGASDDQS